VKRKSLRLHKKGLSSWITPLKLQN